ncbi:S8 family serine peptidase [Phenylobacterium sp.]|uniref:S8 family serine peptidase n=1 Tax=Phenylobacterium sp. TaxID=1871053 RepID=UPI002732F6A8|nr:S8 family serine peptidase [Phenylobacterium sp.]MDP3853920.1 S8 family serine peptidase [Phenylobacterium sp.]
MALPDSGGPPAAGGPALFTADEILIQFTPGLGAAGIATALAGTGVQISEFLRSASGEGQLARALLPPGLDPEKAVDILSHMPGVKLAEPNWVYTIQATSNDPAYLNGSLWGMYGDQTAPANTFGSQAAEAWALGHTGKTSAGAGVIDTGIDYTHADLYLNVWLNPREIPVGLKSLLVDTDSDGLITFRDLNNGANGGHVSDLNANGRIDAGDLLNDARWENNLDDDANGYKDDLIGWDFVNNDNDPYDDNSHGTHVSGTIAAIGGNAVGVAGVNWSAQVMGLKFLDASGSGSSANAIKALDYLTTAAAAGGGVDFVASNNSWGGGGFSQLLLDAITRGAQQDILFVAAAGNGDTLGRGYNLDSSPFYPASYSTLSTAGYEAVVAVASITSTGALSSFSNYGPLSVDLGAPGSSINSTIPGGGYGLKSGTSMATPHVTGALLLYSAVYGPAVGADAIRTALLQSVTPTASLLDKVVSDGRLDITKMLAITPSGPPAPSVTISPAVDDVAPKTGALVSGATTNDNNFTLSGSLSKALETGQTLVIERNGTAFAPTSVSATGWSLDQPGLGDGAYTWVARILDSANSQVAASDAYALTIDTIAPLKTAAVTSAYDSEEPATGQLTAGDTDDTTPRLQGSLSAGLEVGEKIVVYRDGAVVGTATVSADGWQFQETTALGAGVHSWRTAVEDSAGNQGALSDIFSLNIRPANVIYGTTTSDIRIGTDWTDKIWGVPQTGSDVGKGDIDRMTGGGGADMFVLGASGRGRFYDDGKVNNVGTNDYAFIQDFTKGVDKIQLAGSSGQYLTGPTTTSLGSGVGIYFDTNGDHVLGSRDELIGLVVITNGASLSSSDFLFV